MLVLARLQKQAKRRFAMQNFYGWLSRLYSTYSPQKVSYLHALLLMNCVKSTIYPSITFLFYESLHLLGLNLSISVFLSLPLLGRRQAVCRNNRELLYLNSAIGIFYLVGSAPPPANNGHFPGIPPSPFPSQKRSSI